MEELTDKKLVELCVLRDKEAWSKFVGKYTHFINSIIRKKFTLFNFHLTNEDVEEIASNTLNSLLEKDYYLLKKYNPVYSLTTWIGVIASTQCNRFLRKGKIPTISLEQKTDAGPEKLQLIDKLQEKSEGPEIVAEKAEISERIKKALGRLNPRDKLIMTMLFFDQISYEEIANALNMSEKSISKTIFRAKNLKITSA